VATTLNCHHNGMVQYEFTSIVAHLLSLPSFCLTKRPDSMVHYSLAASYDRTTQHINILVLGPTLKRRTAMTAQCLILLHEPRNASEVLIRKPGCGCLKDLPPSFHCGAVKKSFENVWSFMPILYPCFDLLRFCVI
jgi:hypothetical protein